MIALLLTLVLQGSARTAPQVTARLSPEAAAIGEPVTVELRVRAAPGTEVRFPALPDSSDVLEPLDPRLIRDASTSEGIDRTAVYRLIAWDTGQRVLRFGDITVGREGAERRYAVALPVLRIRSVLPADSAQRVPRPARDLMAIPGSAWRILLALSVVLGLGAWAWRAWRGHVRAARARGPDAAADADLGFSHASRMGLLEAGEPGRFALVHVAVMRRYLSARFPEAAPSRTARELADALVGVAFPILPERVTSLLVRSEGIAFARAPLNAHEARAIAEEARAIVRDVETAMRSRAAASPASGRGR